MKKIYAVVIFLITVQFAQATVHTVLVADFNFLPASVTAACGDTVEWVWSNGTHTTTSTSVPSCATAWNSPITFSVATFSIVITCEGTYNYHCTVHPQMTGNIIATCATGIQEPTVPSTLLSPNPFTESVNVVYQNKDHIILFNMLGRELKDIALVPGNGTIQLELADLPRGIYFLGMFRKGVMTETKKIAKE